MAEDDAGVVGARCTVVGARSIVVGARHTVVGARSIVVGARRTMVGARSIVVRAVPIVVGAIADAGEAVVMAMKSSEPVVQVIWPMVNVRPFGVAMEPEMMTILFA